MIFTAGIPLGEERTYEFAKNVRRLVKKLPKSVINIEDGKQLVQSSGSASSNNYVDECQSLINEAVELKKIFSSIVEPTK